MSATGRLTGNATDLALGAAICAGSAITITAATALAVALLGLAPAGRHWLDFRFKPLDRSVAEVGRIALHNARLVVGILVCATTRPQLRAPLRRIPDGLLAVIMALNAGLVGVALGAYGSRVASALALHAPLELASLSLAGGAYIEARKRPLSRSWLMRLAALCALLLAAAATLETYGRPGGFP